MAVKRKSSVETRGWGAICRGSGLSLALACTTAIAACAPAGESQQASTSESEPAVYEEVLLEYWGGFSPALKVTTCDLAAESLPLAAGGIVLGLEADLEIDLDPADIDRWNVTAETFLESKCQVEERSESVDAREESDIETPELLELELWLEFWNTETFTADGEYCTVRLDGSKKRAFREGAEVVLVNGAGREISSSTLAKSLRRTSVSYYPPDGSNLDAFEYPCVVRAVFKDVPRSGTYGIRLDGSDLAGDWVWSLEDVLQEDNRLALVIT